MELSETQLDFTRVRLGDPLVQDLRRAIRTGRLKPGQPILSDRKLSERYSISPASVRRALNELASEGLIERRARSGTFVRETAVEASAAEGRVGRLVRVVFYLPVAEAERLNAYYTQLVLEIERTLRSRGWDMIFSPLRELAEARSILNPEGDPRAEAGQILIGPIDRLAGDPSPAGTLPRVFVDHQPECEGADTVNQDDWAGMHRGVESLLELGHRRIAYVGGADSDDIRVAGRPWPNSVRREAAWRQALQLAGSEARNAWSLLVPPTSEGGRVAFERLAALQPRPTAAVTFSTGMAAGLVAAAREAGVRVPEDLSVIAFGVVEDGVPGPRGELALLKPDARALGRGSAELLVRRVSRPEAPAREVLVPVELKRGATLGRAPGS